MSKETKRGCMIIVLWAAAIVAFFAILWVIGDGAGHGGYDHGVFHPHAP